MEVKRPLTMLAMWSYSSFSDAPSPGPELEEASGPIRTTSKRFVLSDTEYDRKASEMLLFVFRAKRISEWMLCVRVLSGGESVSSPDPLADFAAVGVGVGVEDEDADADEGEDGVVEDEVGDCGSEVRRAVWIAVRRCNLDTI